MTNQLELKNVRVSYGDFDAVKDVSLNLEKGQIGCLLGPSGCGKTTLLRAIAGFEAVAAGEVAISGRIVSSNKNQIPPEQRKVGMVFQDFALFPHLNIERNVGFGLAQLGRSARQSRIAELLSLVGLESSAKAFPHELSGGQQQRVALARAMAPEPDILLLDEPFSNLDSELREQLAGEVGQILRQKHITALLVTHDQQEAFAMADHISVLNAGLVAQTDTPYNLYHNPGNEFVAGFIGQGTLLNISVNALGEMQPALGQLNTEIPTAPGDMLRLLIRPDDIVYDAGSETSFEIIQKAFRGAHYLYQLKATDGQIMPCLTPSHVDLPVGAALPISFNMQHHVVFKNTRL
ncbi:MAG: ABC transporter ATP-binding protein [Halioglobus sp.]